MSLLEEETKNNENNTENKFNSKNKTSILLPYYFKKNIKKEDPSFPLSNLEEEDIINGGWVSPQNCQYPLKLIVKFKKNVDIKQMVIIINENKIPTKIQLINCIKIKQNKTNSLNKYKYENIGFITLSSNEETNYKFREFRKLELNIYNTNRIKILIYENYKNSYNIYNQVGIVSLQFYGNINNDEKESNNDETIEEEEEEIEEEEEVEEEEEIEEKEKEKEEKKEKEEEIYAENNKKIDTHTKEKNDKKKIKLLKIKNIPNEYQNKNANIYNNNDKKENIDKINNKFDNILKYKSNKIIKNENIKFIGKEKKIENKENNLNLIENKMERIKNIIEKNEKEKINQENKQFKNLQNQIDELKTILNKIYKGREKEYKIIYNEKEKENNIKNNNKYIKIKTMNNENISNRIQKIKTLSPLQRNNSMNYPLSNNQKNIQNIKLNNKNININSDKKKAPNLNYLSYNNFPLLNIRKRITNYNSENEKNNYNSLNESYDNEDIEDKSTDELPLNVKEKYNSLITLLGEDIFKKLFSKNVQKQEEAFNYLIENIKDIIINKPENIKEANLYILSLINIFNLFIDEKHPIIVMKCLELFINLLKAIEEKSNLNKLEYDFKISKNIINKIKEKFSHASKRIRIKAIELYCYMLDSNLCDFYSLISELIEKEINEYFYEIDNLNNGFINRKTNNGFEINKFPNIIKNDTNKNLIITKMNIFLKIFTNDEFKVKKFNNKKFPQKIVGDYIIMNINNTKEEVREITKNVLVKYINIFGNEIFYKLKLVIGNNQLTKIIHNNEELIKEMRKYEFEKSQKLQESKKLLNKMKTINRLPFLTPLNFGVNNITNSYYNKNQYLMRSSSQPKYIVNNKRTKLNIIN